MWRMRRFVVALCVVVMGLGFASGVRAQTSGAATALEELHGHLEKMKTVATLAVRFVCEKRLAALESPLVSEGRLWIQKTEKGGTRLRFSTEKPYVSELILSDNKVFARSQHESTWTVTDQAARPGLAVVMMELGGWSTGQPGALADAYDVARAPADASLPDPPATTGSPPSSPPVATNPKIDMYILTPKGKDLKAAVQQVEIAIDRESSVLMSVRIATAQGDETRYWFLAPQINGKLTADTFNAQ